MSNKWNNYVFGYIYIFIYNGKIILFFRNSYWTEAKVGVTMPSLDYMTPGNSCASFIDRRSVESLSEPTVNTASEVVKSLQNKSQLWTSIVNWKCGFARSISNSTSTSMSHCPRMRHYYVIMRLGIWRHCRQITIFLWDIYHMLRIYLF